MKISDSNPSDTIVPYVPGTARIASATVTSTGGPANIPPGTDLTTLVTLDSATGAVTYDPASFAFLNDNQKVVYSIEFDSSAGPDTFKGTLTSTINGVNDPPVITAAALTVAQGGTVLVTPVDVGVSDPDSLSFVFTVTNVSHGSFQAAADGVTWVDVTTFTSADLAAGHVRFVHDGSASPPTFSIQADDGGALHNLSDTIAGTVTYTSVNNAPVITAASLTVSEGGTVLVAPADFGVTDPDSSSFTFTATNVTHGSFQSTTDGVTWVNTATFTSADLAAGHVRFVHDGGEAAPTFSIQANDGVNFSNDFVGSVSFTNVNDLPTGTVTISGTVQENQVLTASNTLADADGLGAISYQWQRDGVNVVGATATTYTLGNADVGHAIDVVASYTDGHGTLESKASAATALVTNVNDLPTGTVTISGTAQENQVLTASNTLADADGLGAISYQWQRDGVNVVGATAATYTLGNADVGHAIDVVASYTDGHGTLESKASAATALVTNVNDLPTGTVTISGTAQENQVLTASNTLADADGLGAISYQWQRDGVNVVGATATTYTLGNADVGHAIDVVASYTDGHGTLESKASAATALVTNVNDLPTGTVTISGTAQENQVLTASNTLADADGLGAISYQWQRDGVNVVGATAATYTLGNADVGHAIDVVASYTDGHGTLESKASAATALVTNVNDLPTGTVTISGTAQENQVLTASNTLADADGLGAISYQWQRDGVNVVGATATTYTLGNADVGHAIDVVASYTDGHGTLESKASAATALVTNVNDPPTGTVTISGTAQENQVLTASNTLADADGLGAISYQWQRDGVNVVGATAATYTLGNADVGHAIDVVASYTDGHGTLESKASAATALVTNVNDPPTGTVTISGTAQENQVLTASNTLADADGLGAISYQWQRDGVNVVGATAATYTLGNADVGHAIDVVASYTDGHGTLESKASAATALVTNVNDPPTGTVTISGTAQENQVLTASNTLADADGLGAISYQWQRDGVNVVGATAATYTLGNADVGHAIDVVASYTDGHGTLESKASAATALVTNVNDPPTGTVTISGTAQENQVLTASNTLADADGLGAISYQWQRDGVNVVGATAATYTLGNADVGHAIDVVASYTDGHGTLESKASAATALVTNVNDPPTGTVTISGTAQENQVLTASNTLADADGLGAISYQWQRDGVNVVGATAATYTLGNADVGHAIDVVASYTDGHGTLESKASAATALVTNVNDLPTGTVTISGTAQENQVLTASNTLADADGLGAISYQWQRDGVNVVGATAATYTLGNADVGHAIDVVASYTDGHGTLESKASAATALVTNVNDPPTGTVTISGTAQENQVLTASNTLADADGLGAISYQWQRDGVNVVGATAATYTLGNADVGHAIDVVASYTDGHGTLESKASAATALVTNVNDPPTGTVTISGTAQENQVLTASNTLADADGLGAISYQWQRDGVNVVGATAATYTLGNADVGHAIDVVASYTDGHGTLESKASAATALVTNVNDPPTGTVTISGTAQENQVLTASNTLADADGLGAISYQWQRDGVNVVGATATTYTLGNADVGHAIDVVASYTDGHGTLESKASAATALVTNVNDPPTGTVTISGTAQENQVLTASNTLADADGLGAISYQWQRDGVNVVGATGTTYTLGNADVGHAIDVVASYTDGHGTLESKASAATALVTNVNNPPTGTVTISGTAQENQVLTASNTLADADGLGAISYQWQRDGVNVVGATGATYTLGNADVGHAIDVVASYTDGHGTLESKASAATALVTNVNDPPTGTVTISGTAQENQVLTASNTLADADGLGAISYQWQRDGVNVVGATGATYTLGNADVGHAIDVVASYTDGHGTLESKASAATALVTNVNDPPTGTVTISGTAQENQVLTASNTLADADGLGAISYQWQRDGVNVVGATGATYTLGNADVGHAIDVVASYTDGHGTLESKASAATALVTNVNDAPTGTVTISGTAQENQVLTASNTLADADGLGAISYQWQRDGVNVVGATGTTYTLGNADVGHAIDVVASYTDGHGTLESKASAATALVTNVNDPPTGTVTISGTAQENQVLTASNTLADADGLGAISYQWQRDGVNVVGATGTTYTLGNADVGHAIDVVASYTDGHGTLESKASAATAVVTNVNDPPTGTVTISGTAQENQVLTASNTLADADGLGAISYQWQRDGVNVVGATGATYTLGDADVGHAIDVVASYTDGHGTRRAWPVRRRRR